MNASEMKPLIEALIFAASEPVTAKKIAAVVEDLKPAEAQRFADELMESYEHEDRGVRIRFVAGGYQMVSKPDFAPWIRALTQERRAASLSRAALEVLAITAYRQPVTIPEISEIRGVSSEGPLKTLLSRKLVRITGRKSVVGRPILYGTTQDFLLQFGLRDIEDLPDIEEFEDFIAAEDQYDVRQPSRRQPSGNNEAQATKPDASTALSEEEDLVVGNGVSGPEGSAQQESVAAPEPSEAASASDSPEDRENP